MKHLSLFIFFLGTSLSAQKTILWSIKSPSNDKISYLLGTFHQLGNSFVDSIPEIEKKLKSSELAIFESIDDPSRITNQINVREDNKETIHFIESNDFLILKELAKNWKVHLNKLTSTEIILKLQQSLPSVICDNVKETDTFSHFDNYLVFKAKQNNVPVFGFESDSMQLKYINQNSISKYNEKEKQKIVSLCKILNEKDKTKYNCEFDEKYKKFDINYKLNTACNDDILLKQRNQKWIPVILDKIKKQNCFITVGLFHLYNDCGLITQLRQNGFTVEPITLR